MQIFAFTKNLFKKKKMKWNIFIYNEFVYGKYYLMRNLEFVMHLCKQNIIKLKFLHLQWIFVG